MTQRHYVKIAERIAAHVNLAREVSRLQRSSHADSQVAFARELVSSFCVIFAEDNPRFKADVFVKACGF